MAGVFTTEKRVGIPNHLRTSINPGSNDKGDGDGDGNEPNKQMKKCKAIWTIVRTSEKILTTPLEIILNTLRTVKLETSIDMYLYSVFKFVFSYFLIYSTVNINVIFI